MPLGDWTVSIDAGCAVTAQNIVSFSGNALRFQGIGGPQHNIVGHTDGGLESGIIRSLIRVDSGGTQRHHGLFCCMAGAVDNLAEAYWLCLQFNGAGGAFDLTRKVRNPDGGSIGTVLANATRTLSSNTWYAIALKWQRDHSGSNEILLSTYYGTATDFSDLALVSQVPDNAPAITAPYLAAGCFASFDLPSNAYFDNTRIQGVAA